MIPGDREQRTENGGQRKVKRNQTSGSVQSSWIASSTRHQPANCSLFSSLRSPLSTSYFFVNALTSAIAFVRTSLASGA